jgi:hypothetical protein
MASAQHSDGISRALQLYRFLNGAQIVKLNQWIRLQDAVAEKPSFPGNGNEDCLYIFVSHRWESEHNPDPEQSQLHTIQGFLGLIFECLQALLAGIEGTDPIQQELPERLDRHGMPQAIYFAMLVLLNKIWNEEQLLHYQSLSRDERRDYLFERIQIWYDFACLPQRPRSQSEEDEFRSSLLHLNDLLRDSRINLISLRDPQDDYEQRGWCYLESVVSSTRSMAAPGMILRTDVTQGQILPSIMDTDESRQRELANAFRKWRELTERVQDLSNSLSAVVFSFFAKIQYCFWVFPFSQDPFENDGEFPCCTRLLRVEHSRMESLLWVDLASKLQGPQPFDLGELIANRMHAINLHCTNGSDIVLCSILLLLASRKVETAHSLNWKEALLAFNRLDQESNEPLLCSVEYTRQLGPKDDNLQLPQDIRLKFDALAVAQEI